MIESWLATSGTALLMVTVSAVAAYAVLILLTRLMGLRSFTKFSSFDFPLTIAIGSLISSTILLQDPPLLRAIWALAVLYGLQMLVATGRLRLGFVRRTVDNTPVLLMAGTRILEENMKKAKVSPEDLMAHLRRSNVSRLDQVGAVIMETSGDISVLTRTEGGAQIDEKILQGVRDRHLVSGGNS